MMSVSDIEYRRMAWRANARLRALEKLGGESPAAETAGYYLENRKRFPEHPERMSESDKEYYRKAAADFLNDPYSMAKREKQRRAFVAQLEEEDKASEADVHRLWQSLKQSGIYKQFDYKTIRQIMSRVTGRGSKSAIDRAIDAIRDLAWREDLTRKELEDAINQSISRP